MAAQRIVITSPWKLGLFVFLLVVGTGFGLIYAYLELFGGSIDLNDETQLKAAYIVLGCVAGLGLMGYLAVVTSARPLDRVVRGSRRRDQLIKRLGGIEDPRNVDLEDFEGETALTAVLERWTRDVTAMSDAQMLVAAQRESIASLTAQLKNSAPQLSLGEDEITPDLGALIEAIESYSRQDAPAPASTPEDGWGDERGQILEAAADLARTENELVEFVTSVAESAQALSQRTQNLTAAPASGAAASGPAYEAARHTTERIADLRQTLDTLAEEANKLAITMALQLSRIGDAGNEMVDTAESLRSLSTRYQRLAADLRTVEMEQVNAIERLAQASGGGAQLDSSTVATLQQQAMILDQNAEALRELLGRWHGPMQALRNWAPDMPGGAQMPPAAAAPEPREASAPAAPRASQPESVDADASRVYEIAELGGREIAAEAAEGGDEVYDLDQFGAVEL